MIDQDLLSEVQYAVLEPPDGGQSFPSEVWRREEVIDLLNEAIWSWQRDTLGVVTRVEQAIPAVGLGLVTKPTDWLATGSLVWRTAANVRTPLGPADRFEADTALPTWETTAGTPLAYAEFEGDTQQIQLMPIPDADGTLEWVYVARPAAVLAHGITLPVPEEFLSGIKYAILGGMLRKVGRLLDQDRAAYCEQRYDLSVTLTQILLGGFA